MTDWITSFVTVFGSVGGLTLIQWIANRRSEKRQSITKANSDQFELFQKMNDYLSEQIDIFKEKTTERETSYIQNYEKIANSIMEISASLEKLKNRGDVVDAAMIAFNKELLRLQLLHFLTSYYHLKSVSEKDHVMTTIECLYKEYKEKYNGNSYVDNMVTSIRESYTRSASLCKKTPKN